MVNTTIEESNRIENFVNNHFNKYILGHYSKYPVNTVIHDEAYYWLERKDQTDLEKWAEEHKEEIAMFLSLYNLDDLPRDEFLKQARVYVWENYITDNMMDVILEAYILQLLKIESFTKLDEVKQCKIEDLIEFFEPSNSFAYVQQCILNYVIDRPLL